MARFGVTLPKEGQNMKIKLPGITVTPLKFNFSGGQFYEKIDWSPWGAPVRGDPDKTGSSGLKE